MYTTTELLHETPVHEHGFDWGIISMQFHSENKLCRFVDWTNAHMLMFWFSIRVWSYLEAAQMHQGKHNRVRIFIRWFVRVNFQRELIPVLDIMSIASFTSTVNTDKKGWNFAGSERQVSVTFVGLQYILFISTQLLAEQD